MAGNLTIRFFVYRHIHQVMMYVIFCLLISCNQNRIDIEKIVAVRDTNVTTPQTKTRNDSPDIEKTIKSIIKAFQQHDDKILDKFTDSTIGFYLVPGRGTLPYFQSRNNIPKSDYYFYGNDFGKVKADTIPIKYEKSPVYDCENYSWNKYGIFVDTAGGKIFSYIINHPLRHEMGPIPDEEIKEVTRIEKMSIIVSYTIPESGDIIFGLAEYKGRYILTYLDISISYCDV